MSDALVLSLVVLAGVLATSCVSAGAGEAVAGDGWKAASPRAEIRPTFSARPTAGPDGKGTLAIQSAKDVPQQGAWVKTFRVEGGAHWRFEAWRKATGVACPRRSCVVKITWQDAKGRGVKADSDVWRPSYPMDRQTAGSWTRISDTYPVPRGVSRAVVELELRWAAGGKVEWGQVSLTKVPAPPPRKVRLAAVHYMPRGGKSPADNRKLFVPLIESAARKKADLVVLGECITKAGNGVSLAAAAEAVPGPSTKFFGQLARKHDLYIVVGLIERDGPVIYNTAALVGPEGKMVGKYRKVCLPREEIQTGTAPGSEYPVFDTRLGKVGMMICWDVFFPEVARHLANAGAEIIALPIWGGSPDLAKARAIENQVYLVTSTYTDPKTNPDWMKSGVWDHKGTLLVEGKRWGTVVVAEVDLGVRTQWWWLGDFKARVHRERPPGTN